MPDKIKIAALEEHVALTANLEGWLGGGIPTNPHMGYGDDPFARRLRSLGEERITDMDNQGIDVAVLSLNSPGVQNLKPADSVAVAREANEQLAAAVAQHPDRFQAWAAISTPDPTASVEELEYAVTRLGLRGAMLYGRTGEDLADHPAFDDLYAAAERLPLHLRHPTRRIPIPRHQQRRRTLLPGERALHPRGEGSHRLGQLGAPHRTPRHPHNSSQLTRRTSPSMLTAPGRDRFSRACRTVRRATAAQRGPSSPGPRQCPHLRTPGRARRENARRSRRPACQG